MPANPGAELERQLRARLAGARRLAVVGVGDDLNPFDQLGGEAAKRIRSLRLPRVRVFMAGVTPEAYTGPVRRFAPEHILILDAADFGKTPGSVAVLAEARVRASLFSTHSIPLPVVMAYLEETCGAPVTLVGLQPDFGKRSGKLTAREAAGAARLARALASITRRPARPQRAS